MSVDERDTVWAGGEHGGRSRLVGLLAQVAERGWGSDAGRQAIGIMRVACRRAAAESTRTAGWLTDEGLSVVWEQMDRLVRTGRFADGPGLLRIAARRAYAAEAAAAMTGLGSASTRGLIGAVRRSDVLEVRQLADEPEVVLGQVEAPAAPPWMRILAAVLARQGWAWPIAPLHAVMASAATWSALELLTLGSGLGCRPEARTTGVAVQIDLAGAAGVLRNRDLMRIVRAVVAARTVRTGRRRAA